MSKATPEQDLKKLDKNFATPKPEGEITWYDIRRFPIEGKGWTETKHFYDRLPAKAEGVVPPPVWSLSRHSTGMCVRFVTDAAKIDARWTLRWGNLAMDHMPATGVSGLDLYAKMGGKWQWIGVGRATKLPTNTFTLVGGMKPVRRQYILYLPLYNGVESVEIGLPPDAHLEQAPARRGAAAKPMCFYGTSITQGGCASRPGMAYSNILGRWLERPTINLGFSGNGRSEPEVASLLAELDLSVLVVDPIANMNYDLVLERIGPLVEKYRAAHPTTPIVLMEPPNYPRLAHVHKPKRPAYTTSAALRKVYAKLIKAGVKGLTYVKGGNLYGDDGEGTVDGCHATDVGFLRMAAVLKPILRKLV